MKRILLILLMMGGIAYGQCPEVTGLSVSNLSTTGGKATYTAASGATLYVWGIYIPGGAFVTGGSTTSTTFNFTGLTASTTYRLKVRTTCGLSVSGDDSLTFSTLSATAMYTPLTAQGYQIKYLKVDSGFNLPLHDTTLLRGINQAGAQVYKPGAGVFVYNGSYWQGISGGTGTIIITDSSRGIDSITFNGYMECIYLHDSIIPRCWQLNTFFDDVRLSDDSTLYEFYNGDSLVKTVLSGIKNVGAVWPLSSDGVDLTTSKPFNDSLYLSSLVKHSDSLFSKKLTGDSVFVGLMSGSGGSSSGIDSMYVTTDSLYQVFIYHSGRRDSVGYSGSSGTSGGTGTVTSVATGIGLSGGTITSSGTIIADTSVLTSQTRTTAGLALKENFVTAPFTTLKYATGYKTFGSFYDTARAAVSLSFSATGSSGAATGSYSNSTGVFTINVPTYTLAGLGGISLSSLSATGTGISYNNATGVFTGTALIASDTVNKYPRLVAGTNVTLSGTYPNITIASSGGGGLADSIYFWKITGNYGMDTATNFLGTKDNVPLIFRQRNVRSGFIGDSVLRSTAFGYGALASSILKFPSVQTAGSLNSAFGYKALTAMTTGHDNTAMGPGSLSSCTSCASMTAIGASALSSVVTGSFSVAIGVNAMSLATGIGMGIGYESLRSNTDANGDNTGVGYHTLYANTSGRSNTAIGYQSMENNLTGSNNTAVGNLAMTSNTGSQNTAFGHAALYFKVGGSGNIAIGYAAGQNHTAGDSNTIVGYSANLNGGTSSGGVYLGNSAGSNNTSNSKLFIANSISNNLIHGDFSTGQVQINAAVTPSLTTSAQFEVISTTKGVLIPRMTTTQKNAISSPAEGLEVYDLTLHQKSYYNGTTWINY